MYCVFISEVDQFGQRVPSYRMMQQRPLPPGAMIRHPRGQAQYRHGMPPVSLDPCATCYIIYRAHHTITTQEVILLPD